MASQHCLLPFLTRTNLKISPDLRPHDCYWLCVLGSVWSWLTRRGKGVLLAWPGHGGARNDEHTKGTTWPLPLFLRSFRAEPHALIWTYCPSKWSWASEPGPSVIMARDEDSQALGAVLTRRPVLLGSRCSTVAPSRL